MIFGQGNFGHLAESVGSLLIQFLVGIHFLAAHVEPFADVGLVGEHLSVHSFHGGGGSQQAQVCDGQVITCRVLVLGQVMVQVSSSVLLKMKNILLFLGGRFK